MERAALSRAQRDHGGEEKAARGETHGARRGSAGGPVARPPRRAPGGQDRRRGLRGGSRAGAAAAGGGAGVVSDVLAALEQRDGALPKGSPEVVTGAVRAWGLLGGV